MNDYEALQNVQDNRAIVITGGVCILVLIFIIALGIYWLSGIEISFEGIDHGSGEVFSGKISF